MGGGEEGEGEGWGDGLKGAGRVEVRPSRGNHLALAPPGGRERERREREVKASPLGGRERDDA